MAIKHKVFLKWLLYITLVIFTGATLTYYGIPQLAFFHDHIWLGSALFLMYLAAEIMAGTQAVWLSRECVATAEVLSFLRKNRLTYVDSNDVALVAPPEKMAVSESLLRRHLSNLIVKSQLNRQNLHRRVDQHILLDALADRLYSRILIADFIGARIVWIGILATILGVVLVFWPFVTISGVDVEQIRSHLGPFFRGLAVAFLPTSISFVCKIALDINTRILTTGAADLLHDITEISETYVIPTLERQ